MGNLDVENDSQTDWQGTLAIAQEEGMVHSQVQTRIWMKHLHQKMS